mmetsp:Transcript_22635/g.37397  ORF Transcript_22635/g.37397 Transcript_22635/m.37397 type:complete len:210 (+) Transcript_22635:563-1192(+)
MCEIVQCRADLVGIQHAAPPLLAATKIEQEGERACTARRQPKPPGGEHMDLTQIERSVEREQVTLKQATIDADLSLEISSPVLYRCLVISQHNVGSGTASLNAVGCVDIGTEHRREDLATRGCEAYLSARTEEGACIELQEDWQEVAVRLVPEVAAVPSDVVGAGAAEAHMLIRLIVRTHTLPHHRDGRGPLLGGHHQEAAALLDVRGT